MSGIRPLQIEIIAENTQSRQTDTDEILFRDPLIFVKLFRQSVRHCISPFQNGKFTGVKARFVAVISHVFLSLTYISKHVLVFVILI